MRVVGYRLLRRQTTGAGAAFGTAKSGIGIAGVGIYRPDLIMKVRREHTNPDQAKKRD